MTTKLTLQDFYSTIITQPSGIPETGDFDFTVATPPQQTSGFIVVSANNSTLRDVFYYHNVVGNRIYVRQEGRLSGNHKHKKGEPVQINDTANIFNYFSDMISQAFFVEKTWGLNVRVNGGYVNYSGSMIAVPDTNLTLTNNTTNYITYTYATNTIASSLSDGSAVRVVVVTLAGVITSITYRHPKESYTVPGGGGWDMLKSDNLSWLTNTATARTNIGLWNVDNTSDANKPVSTAQAAADTAALNAAKTYADGLVVWLFDDRGNFDASSNTWPSTGGSWAAGAILKSDLWTISVAGTLGSKAVTAGDVIRALVDTPGTTASNWAISENNFGYVAENSANKDVSGGYAWLTLFKLNMRNVANTITSWFTNSNTVARTYTLPDKDGTVAMTSDITGTNSWTNTWDVTLAGAPNYITIAGQVITRALINLTSHVTWTLPVVNGGTWTTTSTGSWSTVLSTSPVLTTPAIASIKGTLTADTDGTTITFNKNTSDFHSVTMGGNRILALSNMAAWDRIVLRLQQDVTGGRVPTWFTTIKWPGGVAPIVTATANKADVYGFLCTSAGNYDGFIIWQNL